MSDRDCGTKFELCGNCIRCLRHQRDYARERLKDAASDLADLTDQHEALRAERDEARAEVERLRAEVDAAREALGLAWCSDGCPLADGIRRKTHALESLNQ